VATFSLFWSELGRAARTGLIAGAALIVGLALALGYWAYRPDYQVLFSDVAARDAAAMTAELDKVKTPYTLADGGSTVLVPRDLVYKTRLALMNKDVPLHGAVGFEVFNNADFGMTEFVQKVNYLRAIQGELTRTILAIDGIASARVHLAIPDQGLFKKATTKPKASVTLGMKRGQVLGAEQVAGIQRLVAASVPDIVSGDVTVLDQHGVALTRVNGDGESAPTSGEQLDAKRSTEDYLLKKVSAVLDQTFGAGEAIASVDVALNLDRGKLTTEEVLPAKGNPADQPVSGVVVRDRQTVREADSAVGVAGSRPAAGGTTTTEADYQVGRRVEQVAVAGGTVKRMTVAVVVKKPLTDQQIDKLKEVVSLAVGLNGARGDAIVVNSMERLVGVAAPAAAAAAVVPADIPAQPARTAKPDATSANVVIGVLVALLVLVLLALAASVVARRRAPRPLPRLDGAQREQMLSDVRRWIAAPAEVHLHEARK
jgi:flagellar M-ring protein FliF